MKLSLWVTHGKQRASFGIVSWMLAIAPLGLMLAVANNSAYAQTSDDVSNPSAAAAASSPADWTQFLRENMQRWNPYETVLGVNNVGNLVVKWKNPIGIYERTNFKSSPAVVNGVIYFGSDDHNVYALNASTGAKLWSYTTRDEVVSSPAVANGVVYVGSRDHNVYALNASTGALLWSYRTGYIVDSSPTVANGVVFVGSYDHDVYALDASTGAKLWSYATRDQVFSSPAVANGVAYIGSHDGSLYALNASTGAKLWSYNTGCQVNASPVVANGIVYIGCGALTALNSSTGQKLWSTVERTVNSSTPAVANGVVYSGTAAGNLNALNAITGAKLWSYDTHGEISSSPAVANGVVYFGSGDSNFYALNVSTGAKLWSYDRGISCPAFSSPTIVDGALYIRAGDYCNATGNIYVFGLGKPADLLLRVTPSTTTVHQGDLLTYAFPVWNLGPDNAFLEVLNTQVPAGTVFEYIRISGTPGLGTCTRPPYHETGQIVCHENSNMAPNTTWTVRLTVKVTAAAGATITVNAATMATTPDPNMANNTATASVKVQ